MKKKDRKLYDSWKYKKGNFMEFNNPIFQTLLGLVIFYIGLKMFSGGMKSMGKLEHLEVFIHNPYWMFLGGIQFTFYYCNYRISCFWCITITICNSCCIGSKHRNYWNYLVSWYDGVRWNACRNYKTYCTDSYRS